MISLFDRIILRLKGRDVVIDLEILILIKSYEIELIEDEEYECDENIDKMSSHEKILVLHSVGLSLQYRKISIIPIEL